MLLWNILFQIKHNMGPSTKHQTRNAPFQEKDKCFVMHRDQLYEAKVVKVEAESDGNKRYLVHYNGWGNRHDEWKAHSGMCELLVGFQC